LKKRYRTRLEAEADEFLRYIGVGAKRMEELVWDLLAYTRAGSSGDGPVDVTDSQAVLEQVLENLKPPIEPSHGQVTDDPLPVALIRPRHLEQLFHNLSCNSLKYRKESEPPRIHVSAGRQGSSWRFSVADNGIGIAPEYHEKVFGVFKRLHSNNDRYAGTGIGLAICHKIVERYGGRIWIESEQGVGSVFPFTLPVAPAEHLAQPVSALGSPQ
jgi:light-regulated signal transduction histidine kinase (bacteriophytochrome)